MHVWKTDDPIFQSFSKTLNTQTESIQVFHSNDTPYCAQVSRRLMYPYLDQQNSFFFSKTLAKELKRWTKRFLQNILRNRQPKWWSWRSIYQNTIKIGPLTTQMKTSRTRATFDLLLKLNTSWIEFEASDLLLVLIHVLNKVCCTTLQWNPFDASVIYF